MEAPWKLILEYSLGLGVNPFRCCSRQSVRAHLYGFPSPDSDYDLRGVHFLPLRDVAGLSDGRQTIEEEGIHDGLEVDLVTHDVKKFFLLMLKKNGYVLEQLYSPLIVQTTPEHDSSRKSESSA